jgi:cob(I)alamin adenosyltransferase
MDNLIDLLKMYAKLIGVFGAVIIFGSWIIENIVSRHFKKLCDAVSRAQDDKELTQNFSRIEWKLLEVYQVAASARGYSAEARARDRWTFKDTLHKDVERLERIDVSWKIAHSLTSYIGRTDEFISAINPPAEVAARVRDAKTSIDDLSAQLDKRRDQYFQEQKKLIGDHIDPNTITEEQATQLSSVISKYREDVEFRLAHKLAPAANTMFRSYDALFDFAHQELARREERATMVTRIQIILFIVGSILALLGSYLEATGIRTP